MIDVPVCQEISVRRVIEMVQSSQKALKHLPDISQLKPQLLERTWFYNVINTLDPEFFPSAIRQVDEMRLTSKKTKSSEDYVEMDPAMLKMLEDLADSVGHKRKARSSLKRLVASTKKRKRPIS